MKSICRVCNKAYERKDSDSECVFLFCSRKCEDERNTQREEELKENN